MSTKKRTSTISDNRKINYVKQSFIQFRIKHHTVIHKMISDPRCFLPQILE